MPGRTTGCISVSYGNDIYLSVDVMPIGVVRQIATLHLVAW